MSWFCLLLRSVDERRAGFDNSTEVPPPPVFLVTASSKECLASLLGMWSASALQVGVWMELPLGVQKIWQVCQETPFQSQLSEAVAEM